jgi:two-component system, sensor histidine kinase
MREHLRGTHTRHRQRLLNALLDISRLESGDITPRPTDFPVSTLFRQLYQEFAGFAAGKGLELEVTATAARAHSDPALIHEILHHLLSNAITYTLEGRVRLCCQRDGARVRIEVHDTGIGIPADQLARIYDPFYQASGTDRPREGYGLGLCVVQRMVSLLDLQLDVHSEAGRGSTFALLLLPGVC